MVLGWDFSGLFGLMLGLYGCFFFGFCGFGVGFFRVVWVDAGFIWVFFFKVSVVLGWDFSGLFGLMLGLYGCFFFLGFCGFGVGFFRVVWVDAGFIWVFFF